MRSGKITSGSWAERGGTVTTQVTMADGTPHELHDHLQEAHQKGTRGLTEDYLSAMHRMLHERNRPAELEHTHRNLSEEDNG